MPDVPSLMNFFPRRGSIALCVLLFSGVAALAAPTDDNQIIVPNSAASKAPAPGSSGGVGTITFAAVILLAGAGGWFLWRSRTPGITGLGKVQRQLVLEETRSLGNRQFLVVAGYQDKKFLLGVCPGKIELLAPLTASTPMPEKARS